MKPRVDVIAGFLGAGKTTLIRELIRCVPEGERLAVCENEFGEVGLDGDELGREGVEVLEVNAGCVCCTLSVNLAAGLKLLAARVKPTRILLEPTGLANLPDILNILRDGALDNVITLGMAAAVVDGGALLEQYDRFRAYFDAQLAAASVLFINRTKALDDEGRLRLADIVAAVNPDVRIVPMPADPAALWEALDAKASDCLPYSSLPGDWLGQFSSFALKTGWHGSRERLEALPLSGGFGDIVRAKGFVYDAAGRRYRADLAGGRLRFEPAGEGGQDAVELIGRRLKRRLLQGFIKADK